MYQGEFLVEVGGEKYMVRNVAPEDRDCELAVVDEAQGAPSRKLKKTKVCALCGTKTRTRGCIAP